MRPDIVASYKIVVENLDRFDTEYLAEDAKMIRGVRDAAIVDLVEENAFVLDVRFHGQTEQQTAEAIAERILSALQRDKQLIEVTYRGLLGHEEPAPGLAWTGRDPFDQIVSQHQGHTWVRADYFVHSLSFADLGIGDPHLEHLIISALQRFPQAVPAREAVRRMREMYALLGEVRDFANLPVELEDMVETDADGAPAGAEDAPVEEPAAAPA